jgi:hypothetical protein
MVQITCTEHLDHWQNPVEFLGVSLHPDPTSRFLSQYNEFAQFSLLIFKLSQEIRGGTKVVTSVTRRVLRRAIGFLRLEAIAIGQAHGIQIVSDMLPFDLLLVTELFHIDHFRTTLRIEAHRAFGKCLLPFLPSG